jgi:DNA (cytosine-5)-methyltransferase 1
LWYIDKTFTIASTQDQFIAAPSNNERTTTHPMTTQTTTPQVPLRFLSVCSGMEAASVAWEPLGWKAVGFSEIEPFPCAVLAHRFPNTPNYGSLTEYQSWPLQPGSIDLLVGGTPCQSFSVAGLRKGLADPRGNLALIFLGLADKLKPRWIVWENVPGVLSSDGGRDFGSFLGALEQLGYGWSYRVLDAQYFGVPQRRRRVFVVASLGGRDVAASVLLKPESVCWNPAPRRKKGQATAADAGAGVEAGRGCWWDGGQVSQTLDAVLQKGQTMPEKNRFPAVLQPIVIDRAAFNQGENAQYIPHIEQTDVMDTVVARGPHAVGIPHIVQASELRLKGQINPQDTCPTLLANTKSGDNDPLAVHVICSDVAGTLTVGHHSCAGHQHRMGDHFFLVGQPITFQPGNLRREAGADPSTVATTTLKASAGDQTPHVAYPVVPLDGMNLLSRLGPCGEEHSIQNFTPGDPSFTLKKGGNQHGVLTPMAVRRLTPTECERLQGFPDNWSQIPWKGKPADQCPDGPRYKCAGNSMAVPVMRWIGEQIARVELSLNNLTK